MKLLVIEDDHRLADVLQRGLVDAGHEVDVVGDGRAGLDSAMHGHYDAIVLDWMLPGLDGPSVCRELRRLGNHTSLLMLTARHALPDRIAGLDAGADDYLTKPFEFDELLARLRVFARRGRHEIVRVGDLVIDHERRSATRAGKQLDLTTREFDLLAMLADNAGLVVSRAQIVERVWDGEPALRSNAIDVHIASLRAKVDRPFGLQMVKTVRGVGFQLIRGGP